MADVKQAYRASSNLTVTNLHAIASDTGFDSGWTSGTIDNTTNLDLDIVVSAKFTVESAGLAAGEIRMYAYTMLDDTNWPDLFSAGTEGTEGTCTLHDAEMLGSLYPLFTIVTDTTASRVYEMPQTSVLTKLGFLPRKFALFVSQSTAAALETTGNQVTIAGLYNTVA